MGKLTAEEGKILVTLARDAIAANLKNGTTLEPPQGFGRKQGVFCTLKTGLDVLRGCIGYPYPTMPLGKAVIEAAIASATGDPRFKPVEKDELDTLKLELTVLTAPVKLTCPKEDIPHKIEIGKHGLIIEDTHNSGLLLPQVATENGPWKPVEFLEATCWKAGLPPHAWKNKGVEVFTFEGQIFEED